MYSPMRPQLCARLAVVAASSPDWRLPALSMYGRVRTLLEQDYAEVKQSISGAALPAFVARLKEAVLLLPASAVLF